MKKYILALDQGTTSSRAIIFDHNGKECCKAQQEFEQIYPQASWVEHNPMEILSSQIKVAKEAIAKLNEPVETIAAIGISNQRETTIVWDKNTGEPIYNAIVWQDRRTSTTVQQLKQEGKELVFQEKTGLILDAYFSGTKIKWILDNVPHARQKAEAGDLCFGTVETWLVYHLTAKKKHITDSTNASRTLLFNIHTGQWDDELLSILDIPKNILPQVVSSSEVIAATEKSVLGANIPIAGLAGDQHASTFGNLCISPGMTKNTYGTGCFMLMSTGNQPKASKHKLLSTMGWTMDNKHTYCLEGSVFVGGAAVQWLRDEMHFFDDAKAIEKMATSVASNDGVYLVPAFAGLGAPHWDSYARGMLIGLTRGTKKAHIARATLESIAFQVYDLAQAMQKDADFDLKKLRVDGGACANNFLMQFQADLLNCTVERPQCLEQTALGAAYFAGLAVNFWQSIKQLENIWTIDRKFEPQMNNTERKKTLDYWHEAVSRSKGWIKA